MSYINRIPKSHSGTSGTGQYVETIHSITPTAATWTNVNVNSLYSIPNGAVVEVLCLYNGTHGAAQYTNLGIRGGDSSDSTRFIPVHRTQTSTSGYYGYKTYATVNSSGNITTYATPISAGSYTNARFVIVGYWTGVTFHENFVSLTTTNDNTWRTYTLSDSNANEAVANVVFGNFDNVANVVGTREPGSSIVRTIDVGASHTPGDACVSFMVKTNSSLQFEYIAERPNINCYYMGCFDSGDLDYVEKFTSYSVTANSTWVNSDISSMLDVDGRTADMQMLANNVYQVGVRSNGSSDNRYQWWFSQSTSYYYGPSMAVNSDGTGLIQHYYSTGAGTTYLYGMGYYIPL